MSDEWTLAAHKRAWPLRRDWTTLTPPGVEQLITTALPDLNNNVEDGTMKKTGLELKLGVLAGASAMMLALPQAQAAGGNPFELSTGSGAAIVVADASGEKGISVLEGKCGSGKCGAQRIRQMMDKNTDGRIDRDEYLSWAGDVASREFDQMSKGAASMGVEDVFEHYRSLEFHSQG